MSESLTEFSDADILLAYDNGLADFHLAEKYEHNAHLRAPIRKWLNELANSKYFEANNPPACLNGIACPKCGTEMFDSAPNVILASYPPKKNVHCDTCGYVGYRVA